MTQPEDIIGILKTLSDKCSSDGSWLSEALHNARIDAVDLVPHLLKQDEALKVAVEALEVVRRGKLPEDKHNDTSFASRLAQTASDALNRIRSISSRS